MSIMKSAHQRRSIHHTNKYLLNQLLDSFPSPKSSEGPREQQPIDSNLNILINLIKATKTIKLSKIVKAH